MNSKALLIVPLTLFFISSCTPDSKNKDLSYEETLTYIKNNSKGVKTPKEGYIEYVTNAKSLAKASTILTYLGADPVSEITGRNEIAGEKIKEYIKDSGESSFTGRAELPLMYLTETNFLLFISGVGSNLFQYKLTNLNELIITFTGEECTYIRYYNSSLNLTRFELASTGENTEYTATQTFIYN